MEYLKNISIPKPCHEQWQQMTTVSNGRYCGHCCKTVIDFTEMSNDEVIGYLNAGKNLCGRINPQQLMQLNNSSSQNDLKGSKIKRLLIAALIMWALPFFKAEAKPLHKTEQVEPSFNKRELSVPADTVTRITLKGRIMENDNLPLPGATLQIKGTEISATANADGYFELKNVPVSGVIIARFIGFETTELKIDSLSNSNVVIQLKMQPTILGGFVVVKRVPLPKRIWHTIKNIF